VTKNAVILAAGTGSRLMPLTADKPKCLVPVAGRPIVARALESLETLGVESATMVLGHCAGAVREALGESFGSMRLEYVLNPEFRSTNTMYSLLLAAERLSEGSYVIEGDCVLGPDILPTLAAAEPAERSFWVVDDWWPGLDGCQLRTAASDTRIVSQRIVRDVSQPFEADRDYKSVGLLRLGPDVGATLAGLLRSEADAGKVQVYYDDIIGAHIGSLPIHALRIHPLPWMEVDDAGDLQKAEAIFGDPDHGKDTP